MSKKSTQSPLSPLDFRCKWALLFQRKVEDIVSNQIMLEILEVVLEAQQMALHMIAASLMMRSCGTYSGMIRAPFLLGILKNGDGEMKE
jgi:hypothetical protein